VAGYYAKKNLLGKSGDFITSPEISQLFGEMIALWCLDQWESAGSPTPIRLVELGPGRGQMMADILRIFKLIPLLLNTMTCHLIDISSPLRDLQKQTLKAYQDRTFWHEDLDDPSIPPGFTLILANEFFDALPLSQFILREKGWMEMGLQPDFQGTYEWAEQPCPPPPLRFSPDLNTIVERCPQAEVYAKKISQRLKNQGGAALLIDYGDDHMTWQGDTLQAVFNHTKVPILPYLGQADISHHVDFHGLKDVFRQEELTQQSLVSQGDFLRNFRIDHRAHHLAQGLSLSQQAQVYASTHRLISASEMGEVFKVLMVKKS
jgi:NADH dehydrogenase [ubiquinone] 1 alpha subcomplex assembly factor 7